MESWFFKKGIVFLIASTLGVGLVTPAWAAGDDKTTHEAASASINAALYITFRSNKMKKWDAALAAAALTLAIGAIKETTDDPMDIADMSANARGVGYSLIMMTVVDW
ncbi:MAG: hypothetical protein R2827_13835 [Bdellovibrionales bacterium]